MGHPKSPGTIRIEEMFPWQGTSPVAALPDGKGSRPRPAAAGLLAEPPIARSRVARHPTPVKRLHGARGRAPSPIARINFRSFQRPVNRPESVPPG